MTKKAEETVKIETISLQVGRKKVDLNLAEARELHKILADLFGKEDTTKVVFDPYPIYVRPYTYPWWSYGSYSTGGDTKGTTTTYGSGFTNVSGSSDNKWSSAYIEDSSALFLSSSTPT